MKYTGQTTFDHASDGNGDRIGVLLANLGTPDSCRRGDVRRYLREFLWDPRVVEAPRALWWLLLNLVILTVRPGKSAAAYRKVWGEDGSPLLAVCRKQQRALQQKLNGDSTDSIAIEVGMRYGNPSIAAALERLTAAGVRKLLVLPLYPQYCAVTTAATFDRVCAALSRQRWIPAMRLIDHYHDNPAYIAALADSVRDYRKIHGGSDFLLMSFHGIPQAYFESGDPYHCECHKTARLLAEHLGLGEHEWQVSFQSRFGRKPWLQPYTDQTLTKLAQTGVSDVQVICPGFSADCLETLEEMAMENREVFMHAGGERYGYIPCLNDQDAHIEMLRGLILDNTRDWRENTRARDLPARSQRALAMGAET